MLQWFFVDKPSHNYYAGISNSDKLNIYKVVSAVLAFSNVHFVDSGDSRGKQIVKGFSLKKNYSFVGIKLACGLENN